MGFRSNILLFLVVFNFLPIVALWLAVRHWVQSAPPRRLTLATMLAVILVFNVPIGLFWLRSVYLDLYRFSSSALRLIFLPSIAWQTTALLFTLLLGSVYLIWGTLAAASRLRRRVSAASQPVATSDAPGISRRGFLVGGAGLLVPAIYGVTATRQYRSFDEVDISPEMAIPMPFLPRSFEGMTIVQLSDLHVGPYIRQKELEYWVNLVNGLSPDLVVLTGDIIDRNLVSLPDALQGLTSLRSSLGTLAVLGNHDLSSDRGGTPREFIGGYRISEGLESIGIRTLRNEVTYLTSSNERVAVLGLDWITAPETEDNGRARGSNFYRYHPGATRRQLDRMVQQVPPETPTILLVHHPDTFSDVPPFGIGLTLAGHTHGGGQVVFFNWAGAPVGVSSARFKYVSGFHTEAGCSLYVNRGLGYFGVPIRINCPPEISRFRLVRVQS